tara:strand:- start:5366 stop:5890 length:525 start_codon:yes stop_codon:yes gene_type:complete
MKRGQIWIETVIYTLIGLSLIGVVLVVTLPKITEFKDRATIEQTIDALNIFNSKVQDVLSAPGNTREVRLKMKRGTLQVNGESEEIIFVLDSIDTKYSEPGINITSGKVNIRTDIFGSDYKVTLGLNYSKYDILYGGESNKNEIFSGVSIPYEFIIENQGVDTNGKPKINIRLS